MAFVFSKCGYYLLISRSDIQNIDRYLSKTYTPSDDDILHCRAPTLEIIEMSSRTDDLQYNVFDIGSLPSECENAIHAFARASGFHFLIYTVPLSGFDQCPLFSKSAVCCATIQRIDHANFSPEPHTRVSSSIRIWLLAC